MLGDLFVELTVSVGAQVVFLGFIGGVLSGFIGSGGAFFMTPGMMNLGVPGVVAVASNITHKFGKALVGSRKHGELGNVDRKLALFMLVTSFMGIQLAVYLNDLMFKVGGGHGEASSSAAGDLYISIVFVGSLLLVGLSMLRDVLLTRSGVERSASGLAALLTRIQFAPLVHFRVSGARVSLWLVLVVGLAVGFMAGTIGVGGFLGVPAMIYLFGVPTAVAAGTELYLALYMGAFGAVNYAWQGYVDVRLTLLLYGGSLIGVYIGAYGTKIVKELMIRLVTAIVILICVASRAVAIPVYLKGIGRVSMSDQTVQYLKWASTGLLYAAGLVGMGMILVLVVRAHRDRIRLQARLFRSCVPEPVRGGFTSPALPGPGSRAAGQ
jgi:uncharacterized membrane protein YfcA